MTPLFDTDSEILMHWFNIFLLLIAIAAPIAAVKKWRILTKANALRGAVLVLAGIWCLAGIRAFGFYSLVLAPNFVDDESRLDVLSNLHSEFQWLASLFALLFVVCGVTVLINGVLQQFTQAETHQSRLRQAAHLAKLGYYIFDTQAEKILYCSDAHAQNHGLSKSEYIKVGVHQSRKHA